MSADEGVLADAVPERGGREFGWDAVHDPGRVGRGGVGDAAFEDGDLVQSHSRTSWDPVACRGEEEADSAFHCGFSLYSVQLQSRM